MSTHTEAISPPLKNSFRNEAKVHIQTSMLEEQVIMLRAMECNCEQAQLNEAQLKGSLASLQRMETFMLALSPSDARDAVLESVGKQIAAVMEVLGKPAISRGDEVRMAALESAIRGSTGQPEQLKTTIITGEDAVTLEDVKAEIEEDGLPADGDDRPDDDDVPDIETEIVNPNEVPVKVQ